MAVMTEKTSHKTVGNLAQDATNQSRDGVEVLHSETQKGAIDAVSYAAKQTGHNHTVIFDRGR